MYASLIGPGEVIAIAVLVVLGCVLFAVVAIVMGGVAAWRRVNAGGPAEVGGPPPEIWRRGDVLWAEVRYSDGSGSKDRPVVVLNHAHTSEGHKLVVLKLSSKVDKYENRPDWVRIPSGKWDPSGRDSVVSVAPKLVIDASRVRRWGGRLDPHHQYVVFTLAAEAGEDWEYA